MFNQKKKEEFYYFFFDLVLVLVLVFVFVFVFLFLFLFFVFLCFPLNKLLINRTIVVKCLFEVVKAIIYIKLYYVIEFLMLHVNFFSNIYILYIYIYMLIAS